PARAPRAGAEPRLTRGARHPAPRALAATRAPTSRRSRVPRATAARRRARASRAPAPGPTAPGDAEAPMKELLAVFFQLPLRQRREADGIRAARAERRLFVASLVAARPNEEPVPGRFAFDDLATSVALVRSRGLGLAVGGSGLTERKPACHGCDLSRRVYLS